MSDNTQRATLDLSLTRPKYPLGILILKAQSIAAVSPKLNVFFNVEKRCDPTDPDVKMEGLHSIGSISCKLSRHSSF